MRLSEDFNDYPVRPMFLKVLCILTFIGSGYSILSSIVSYISADATFRAVSKVQSNDSLSKTGAYRNDSTQRRRKEPPVFFKKLMGDIKSSMTADVIRKISICSLIGSLVCLAGALLMWYLKKKGFLLYLAGTIIGIATPFYFYGNSFLGVTSAIIPTFFGILFVIFYAMNLRAMK